MTKALSIAIALLLAVVGFQAFQINGYENKIRSIHLSHAEEKAKSELEKLNSLIKVAEAKDESIKQAENRALQNARHASNAQSELDSLRYEIANQPALPGNCAAQDARIATLKTVFSECAGRLAEMARKSEGHLNDALSARPSLNDVNGKASKPNDQQNP